MMIKKSTKLNLYLSLVCINRNVFIRVHDYSFIARASEDENKQWAEMDKKWIEAQKNEFRELDENGDGILTKDELLVEM